MQVRPHWSRSKTRFFNNIEGSFSKERPTIPDGNVSGGRNAFFATSESLPLAKHLLSTSCDTVSGELGEGQPGSSWTDGQCLGALASGRRSRLKCTTLPRYAR